MISKRARWFLAVVLVLVPLMAVAQSMVDQGQGSTSFFAPWRVTAVGGSGSTSSSLSTYTPSSTSTTLTANGAACTAAGGASCTVILASTEIISWSNVALTIRNSDAADPIDNVLIEFSPDNSNWEVWDSTTFASLTAGSILSLNLSGNARRYIRVEARAAANSASVVHLTMNDG